MRVLITGSRLFHAGYRIDRALVRASAHQDSMTLVTVGRWREGSEAMARTMGDEFGWNTERAESVTEARADICCAFLHRDDPQDVSRIIALKAEKAGIPVWRYYEGGPRQAHPEPGEFQQRQQAQDDDFDSFEWLTALEAEPTLTTTSTGAPAIDLTFGNITYRIVAA